MIYGRVSPRLVPSYKASTFSTIKDGVLGGDFDSPGEKQRVRRYYFSGYFTGYFKRK